jgi:methionyl-tRNA synthetase
VTTREVSIDEFREFDVRVGKVLEVEPVRRTEKLLKIRVDLGGGTTRQIISSIAEYYAPEELIGKKIVILTNLKPAKFSGELSEGMLLAAETEDKLALLTVDRDIEEGTRVT